MAQIHEYTAGTQVAGPTDTRQARVADTGDVGQALSQVGNSLERTAQQLDDWKANSEISDLSVKIAAKHADLNAQLEKAQLAKGAGSDQEFSAKFMASYDEQMSQIVNNTTTGKAGRFAAKQNAEMRTFFDNQAMHAQITMAAHQDVQNASNSLDFLSSSTLQNPAGAANAVNIIQSSIESMKNVGDDVKGKLIAQAKSQIYNAEVQGWIKMDAPGTFKRLEAGEWNTKLDSKEIIQLEGHAKTAIEFKRAEDDRKEKRAKEVFEKNEEAEKGVLLQKLYSNQGLSTDDVLGNPKLKEGTQEHLLKMIEQKNEGKAVRDNGVMSMIWDKIHPPGGGPPQISEDQIERYAYRGLDPAGVDILRKELQGRGTQAGNDESYLKKHFVESVVRGDLVKKDAMGIEDPDGAKHFEAWLADFQPKYEQARRNGKTPAQLLNPTSPDYMGANVGLYKRSWQEIMQSMYPSQNPSPSPSPSASPSPSSTANTNPSPLAAPGAPVSPGGAAPAPTVEPRRPNESAANYLKRVGSK